MPDRLPGPVLPVKPLLRLLLAGLALGACTPSPGPPEWVDLTRGFEPAPLLPLARSWHERAGLDPAEVTPSQDGLQVDHVLPATAWEREPEPGVWSAAFPGGAFDFGQPGFLRLVLGEHRLQLIGRTGSLAAGAFELRDGRLRARLGAEAREVILSQRLEQGRSSCGVWQMRIDQEFFSGLPVWSGTPQSLECRLPARARLCFRTRWNSRAEPAPVTFRVRLDDELVWQAELEPGPLEGGPWHSVPLPGAARDRARLSFEVEGPPGLAAIERAVLAPLQGGSYGARPWHPKRPDLVLFLADTLRADALAAYGGDPGTAPALNQLAEESRRFLAARSNAAWTLPSISTLLTGLAPGQHTANDSDRSLPAEVLTVVERLAAAGYRTGCISDAGFFTPFYGLDQGFEYFRQRAPEQWGLDWSVARAVEFLEQDDGRPLFLLLHTYRTHLPYRVGREEDRSAWDELVAQGYQLLDEHMDAAERARRIAESIDRYRALYAAGVQGLDLGFADFRAELERRGILEQGYLLFTSDHGEALGENQQVFHAGELWETKLRIPLLIRGPRLAAGDVRLPVTLVDVAPTLADLAGLPAAQWDPAWPGESLLRLDRERPSWAFRLQKVTQVSVVAGGKRLTTLAPESLATGACEHAFDLERDPGEQVDLCGQADWVAELARRLAEPTARLLEPHIGSSALQLSPEQQRELEQIGYF